MCTRRRRYKKQSGSVWGRLNRKRKIKRKRKRKRKSWLHWMNMEHWNSCISRKWLPGISFESSHIYQVPWNVMLLPSRNLMAKKLFFHSDFVELLACKSERPTNFWAYLLGYLEFYNMSFLRLWHSHMLSENTTKKIKDTIKQRTFFSFSFLKLSFFHFFFLSFFLPPEIPKK